MTTDGLYVPVRKANVTGTLIITIPDAVAKLYGIHRDDVLEIQMHAQDSFLLRKTDKKAVPGALRGRARGNNATRIP